MKVSGINLKESQGTLPVIDSFVGKGLVEGGHSALPDIDVDYASDRRQEIKEYLEQRYNINGKQRVFSAGILIKLVIFSFNLNLDISFSGKQFNVFTNDADRFRPVQTASLGH